MTASHGPPRLLAWACSGAVLLALAARSPVPTGRAAATAMDPASDPLAVRVVVSRFGPVAVPMADLAALGWDLSTVHPERLVLSRQGRPVPYWLDLGPDGRLDAGDGLLFVGQQAKGPYTRQAVYWLQPDGEPRPMATREAPPGEAPAAEGFPWAAKFEQDTAYDPAMHTADPAERWLWGQAMAAGASRHEVLRLPHEPGTNGPWCTGGCGAPGSCPCLSVRLYGRTDDRGVWPDHHLQLSWDDRLVADVRFDGVGFQVVSATLPLEPLAGRLHRLALESIADTGALVDAVSLDSATVSYSARFEAQDGQLDFTAPGVGRWTYALTGLGGGPVSVLDVTDPGAAVRLTGLDATDGATVRFTDRATAGTRYLAFAAEAAPVPDRMEPNQPSDLHSPSEGADAIVITHPDLLQAVAPLRDLYGRRGLRAMVVSIQDVYDEFSGGEFDPRAIRSFLADAYRNWPPPRPTYVLLVGEANLDYRGGYGTGPPNLVPSVQVPVDGALAAVTSDQWYVELEGDDPVPEMLVGRLSVGTAAEARAAVGKIVANEHGRSAKDGAAGALVIADDGDPAFEDLAHRLAGGLRNQAAVHELYARQFGPGTDLPGAISAEITDGTDVVAFVGHGNVDLWGPWPGGSRIFDNGRIAALHNPDRLPLLLSAACMNGWFDHPLKPAAMAELWVRQPQGGGIAAWAPSGMADLAQQALLLQAFVDRLAAGPAPVGAIVAQAIAQAYARDPGVADTARSFVLFGDPAVVVGFGPRVSPPRPRLLLPLARR